MKFFRRPPNKVPSRRAPEKARRRGSLPRLEALEGRTLLAVDAGGGFLGQADTLNIHDADTQIAVGPTKVVELVNSTIAVFDKATGNMLSQQTMANFFASIAPGYTPTTFYDMVATYDPQAGRFVVGCLYRVAAPSPEVSNLLIAVSNTSDPTAGFGEMHKVDTLEYYANQGGVLHADFATIGCNYDSYTFTMNMFNSHATNPYVQLVTVDRSSLLDRNNSTFTYYKQDLIGTGDLYLMPAVSHDSAAGDPQWFAETRTNSGKAITIVKETNALSASPTFTRYSVPVAWFVSTARSPQPGSSNTIETDDPENLVVAVRGNRLVVGQSGDLPGQFQHQQGVPDAHPLVRLQPGGGLPDALAVGGDQPGCRRLHLLPRRRHRPQRRPWHDIYAVVFDSIHVYVFGDTARSGRRRGR